jgi:hypothetical protein
MDGLQRGAAIIKAREVKRALMIENLNHKVVALRLPMHLPQDRPSIHA